MTHDPQCGGPISVPEIQDGIAKHGHMIIGVLADATAPGFAYTIGLTSRLGFELLVCGLRPQYAHTILNDMARQWSPEMLDLPTTRFSNLPLLPRRCDASLGKLHDEYVVQADNFYGKQVDVVQVILSDREGRTPLRADYDHAYMANFQPLFVSFRRFH